MKDHFNVKYHPLLDDESTPVLFLLPPPPLHCLVLGPGNKIWNALEKLCDELFPEDPFEIEDSCSVFELDCDELEPQKKNPLKNFVKHLCIVKESYFGKVWNGNELKKIFKHLDLLY